MLYNINKHFFYEKSWYIQQNSLTLQQNKRRIAPKIVPWGTKFSLIVSNQITHEGVVVKVEGQRVTVQFVQNSACSGCHAKALCSSGTSDSRQKEVVANSYGTTYEVGDYVRVVVSSGLAWTAVLLAFVIPMVLALVCLFVIVGFTGSEIMGCLVTLLLLGLYFLIVWMQRDRLERKTEFSLERLY